MESSTLLPKIQRNSMFPPRWSRPPCMNIEVKTVRYVAGRSYRAPYCAEHTYCCASEPGMHCSPGWLTSNGIVEYRTRFSLKCGELGSPSDSPPRCQKKYAITLSAISVTVTTGKRMVGMLSFSGNTLRGYYPVAASGPLPGCDCATCWAAW